MLILIVVFAVLGFPILGVEWQKMENPDLRISMGMRPGQKGVRIRRIEPTAPESHVLKPSDIILSFDGIDIANDGTGEIFLSFPFSSPLFYLIFLLLNKVLKISRFFFFH